QAVPLPFPTRRSSDLAVLPAPASATDNKRYTPVSRPATCQSQKTQSCYFPFSNNPTILAQPGQASSRHSASVLPGGAELNIRPRSAEHTSELQSRDNL